MTYTKLNAYLVVAGFSAVSSVVAKMLLEQVERNDELRNQAAFLADILNRNIEVLSEFDRIALSELGILRTPAS